jgi:hypothetical protein
MFRVKESMVARGLVTASQSIGLVAPTHPAAAGAMETMSLKSKIASVVTDPDEHNLIAVSLDSTAI